MVEIIADNILSPLGATTVDHVAAVREGRSVLQAHRMWQMPDVFVGSLFDSRTERDYVALLVTSIRQALSQVPDVDVTSQRVGLMLATTKGRTTAPTLESLPASARRVAKALGFTTMPITVSNACISGLAAQIWAQRLIEAGVYDTVVVAGCDVLNRFVVSGFHSFMALADEPCRPYDADRYGLNLGEAAATIILRRSKEPLPQAWCMGPSVMRNDAYHISGPSRTAEGGFLALQYVTQGLATDQTAQMAINAHGTATIYNDDMESKAIDRAGLVASPVNSLKGYFGHTMGAAGVVETVLTMHTVGEGWLPGTRGYASPGTSKPLCVSAEAQPVSSSRFVKMMSGFGGCNAAVLFRRYDEVPDAVLTLPETEALLATHRVMLTPTSVMVDGLPVTTEGEGAAMLVALYKSRAMNYPKFYKMDPLCRLGFVATELLLEAEGAERFVSRTDRAILFMGCTASQAADAAFEATIQPGEAYFPSPANFVYTLPNIVTGEVAIRNAYHGETTYLALEQPNDNQLLTLVRAAFADTGTRSVIAGYIDSPTADDFMADLRIYEIK